MASRILAQLLIAGGTVVFRAAAQAWHQALANAQRTGVAQEGMKAATRGAQMTVEEAQKILGLSSGAPWPEVLQKYKHLFENNQKHGSFYLVSKVYRAKEALQQEYESTGKKKPGEMDEPPVEIGGQQPNEQGKERQ